MGSKKRVARAKARVPRKPSAGRRGAAKKQRTIGGTSRAGRAEGGHGRAVELVLAAFAHEVRTPLTGILAISSLLETSELGERERRWVETIKASAEHLSALATLFVDAARSGGPGLVLRRDVFALPALARNAGAALAGRAAAKGLAATVSVDDALPALVVGDAVRLRAALENLIDNAVKFTDRGEVGLAVAAKVRPRARCVVTFTVSDSGVGLRAGEIENLFRPFSQANIAIAQRFGGAGLGLSSVRQLARAMGGDVTVKRRGKGGSQFALAVPFEPVAAPSSGDPAAAQGHAGKGRALRLLAVEDNPFGRVVLNAILNELGHGAEFVGRGEDAVERIAQGGFDAVLMDMILPGIDGVAAIRRIRANETTSRVAIIGLSGRDADEAPARAAGADAFLLKPVSPRALAMALAELTRGSR